MGLPQEACLSLARHLWGPLLERRVPLACISDQIFFPGLADPLLETSAYVCALPHLVSAMVSPLASYLFFLLCSPLWF